MFQRHRGDFAWAGGLKRRATPDGNPQLTKLAERAGKFDETLNAAM